MLQSEKFCRIMQNNLEIIDRVTRGFLIRFQDVIITRSSIVVDVVLFERRVSNYWDTNILIDKRKTKNTKSRPGIANGSKKLEL